MPLVIASIGIIVYGMRMNNINITPIKIIGYIILVIFMTVLWYDVELVLRCIPFFVISAANITRLEELLELCMKVPGVLFKGVFKVLFYFILPYGIMSTIPTQFVMETISPLGLVYGIGVVVFFTIFTLWFWRFGLKHYKSASS